MNLGSENLSTDLALAQQLDSQDKLAKFRDSFHFPSTDNDQQELYLVGNSLGLQPRKTRGYVLAELDKWSAKGVRGHFESEFPWAPYHEFLAEPMARMVGASAEEVVVMNSLSVNLHLMMVSFYRPTKQRFKILIEDHAFPSDHYAVESQIKHWGLNVAETLLTVKPREGEDLLREEDIAALIEEQGDEIALILLPGVQYYTGQVLDMQSITRLGQKKGCKVGFDLAHAVGNIELFLHDWGMDFACWCTYKYLNSGPGATGGCFVHQRHISDKTLNRFAGWWGHNKETRFEMGTEFDPIPTAESWQISNAPIFSMAAIRASLDVFEQAGGMKVLRHKSELMIAYMDFLLDNLVTDQVENITPREMAARGCQFSLRLKNADGRTVFEQLEKAGVACDWRYPDVIRVAAVPLYCSFTDIFRFVQLLKGLVQ